MRHKFVQTSKNHNKKSKARKKLRFGGICSESLWILLFPLKILVKKWLIDGAHTSHRNGLYKSA